MVADALKILVYHHHIHEILRIVAACLQPAYQVAADVAEKIVHHIIVLQHLVGQLHILVAKGLQAHVHHVADRVGNLLEIHLVSRLLDIAHGNNLRNLAGLDADALHIRHHLQCRRNSAQIPGHRLLLHQELQADILNAALLLADLAHHVIDGLGTLNITIQQGIHRQLDSLLTEAAHIDHLILQQIKLLVEICSHQPNLPVI